MKLEFDNDWSIPDKNESGKNKLLLNSSKLLSAALARKTRNVINSLSSVLNPVYLSTTALSTAGLYRRSLAGYYRADKGVSLVYNPNYGKTFVQSWSNQTKEDIFLTLNVMGILTDQGARPLLIDDKKRNTKYLRFGNDGFMRAFTGYPMNTGNATFFFVYRPNDFNNRYFMFFTGFNSYLRQTSETTLLMNGSPSIVHSRFSTDSFHVLTVVRKSGQTIRRRLDGVDDGIVADTLPASYSFVDFFKDFNGDVSAFLIYSEELTSLQISQVESYLFSEFINRNTNYNGIQYHAIGIGDSNWTNANYASGVSISSSGLTNEYQREIPYYCKFVENFVSKAEGGSFNSIIDKKLEQFFPNDLNGLVLYVGSGTNSGKSGIISYTGQIGVGGLDGTAGLNTVYFTPNFPSLIDNTSVYEIRDAAVSGIKVTNKVRIKTKFTNNVTSGTSVTIREHALFGGNASKEINTGIIFNHVMLSGTQQTLYNFGSLITLEFLMRLQG